MRRLREKGVDAMSANPLEMFEVVAVGECDCCHDFTVPLYEVSPIDEGAWLYCDECIFRACDTPGAEMFS